jgi:hypothetical protein
MLSVPERGLAVRWDTAISCHKAALRTLSLSISLPLSLTSRAMMGYATKATEARQL